MTRITQVQLAQDIAEFLVFKRALGHSYKRREAILRSFQRYAQAHAGADETVVLEAMISGWLSRCAGRKPVTVALELGVLRQLCLYRRRSDPDGFVPGREWAPLRAESHFLPYVFSREEVRALVDAAGTHHDRNLGAATLRTLLLILHCTGLRLGEAVRLQVSDVDLERGLFVVRESKGKTRLVPFRADLAQVLETYLTERANIAEPSNSGPFLVRNSGHALPVGVASEKIRRLLRKLGLKPLHGRKGPRPTDLRHSCAVALLQAGNDITVIRDYLGHASVATTNRYVTTNLKMKREALEAFWKRAGIAPARVTPWHPKPDLLAFLDSL